MDSGINTGKEYVNMSYCSPEVDSPPEYINVEEVNSTPEYINVYDTETVGQSPEDNYLPEYINLENAKTEDIPRPEYRNMRRLKVDCIEKENDGPTLDEGGHVYDSIRFSTTNHEKVGKADFANKSKTSAVSSNDENTNIYIYANKDVISNCDDYATLSFVIKTWLYLPQRHLINN